MPPKIKQEKPLIPNKKIVLHFEISNVLTINSHNQQLTNQDFVNLFNQLYRLISKYAWGKLQQKDQKSPMVWKLFSPTLCKNPPQGEQVISYYQYIVDKNIIPNQETHPDLSPQQIAAQANKARQNIKGSLSSFAKQGGSGIKLKGQVDRIFKTIPKAIHQFLKSQKQNKIQLSPIQQHLSHGKYNILPAFFKMIMTLKKAKKEFAIVFRTRDKQSLVLEEFNKFCQGDHPCYNGKNGTPQQKFDGSKGTKNLTIKNSHKCRLFNDNNYLLAGSMQQKSLEQAQLYAQQKKQQGVRLYKNNQILFGIMQMLTQQGALWIKCQQDDPVFMDNVDYLTQHILFSQTSASIVYPFGKQIIGQEIKVDLIQLLKDTDYFVKKIEVCQKEREQNIVQLEKGKQREKMSWEELQSLGDKKYLKKTILPLLTMALQMVDRQRPQNPLSMIAFYLLKNKNRMQNPVPIPVQQKMQ